MIILGWDILWSSFFWVIHGPVSNSNNLGLTTWTLMTLFLWSVVGSGSYVGQVDTYFHFFRESLTCCRQKGPRKECCAPGLTLTWDLEIPALMAKHYFLPHSTFQLAHSACSSKPYKRPPLHPTLCCVSSRSEAASVLFSQINLLCEVCYVLWLFWLLTAKMLLCQKNFCTHLCNLRQYYGSYFLSMQS